MALKWSPWTQLPSDKRWYRVVTLEDGTRYSQWDNERAEIRDPWNNAVNRDIAQSMGIPLYEAPRTTPSGGLSAPGRGADARSSALNHFEVKTSQPGASSGTAVETDILFVDNYVLTERPSAAQDDTEDPDDTLGPLQTMGKVLDALTMKGQPIVGDETDALASVLDEAGTLPPEYQIRPGSFFVLGRMFRVLWVEPKGTTSKSYKKDSEVFTTLRPVIVVSKGPAQCTCVPIFSYQSQGVGKKGLTESEVQRHAIVQMTGVQPRLVAAEQKWANKLKTKDAFLVDPVNGQTLSSSSRIRFDAPYTVKFNVKVLELGRVRKEDRPRLQERFKSAI